MYLANLTGLISFIAKVTLPQKIEKNKKNTPPKINIADIAPEK